MKLSMAAELAVRGIMVLTSRHGNGTVPMAEICRARDLPRDYMTRIFAMLSRANLVSSIRGKGGGYRLAREPDQITLLDVIEAVQGPLALNLCQQQPPQCDEEDCPVEPVWRDLQQQVQVALKSKTLAQLVCQRENCTPDDHTAGQ
ncbi:hypothetical protein LCGC14_2948190 [marine sediment metagenome]|uniref:Rrf2 family transcriptional regulator n=1 Tax=marine sediment metagenome TaxID=412755 RepID=A0A0F9A785_9ZZZZ